MILQETIERIRSVANIVDIVSDYVTLKPAGSSLRGLCPFHDDSTPSFSVSPSRGICKCFACGEGGDVVHFLMKQEQIGYIDALKTLAKRYGIEFEERELTEEERRNQSERESMFALNEWACKYFKSVLHDTEEGKTIAQAYFRSRGFRDDIIDKFSLGYCLSSYTAMSNTAIKEGYKEEYLIRTGLSGKRDNGELYDKYRGRVIFPWFSSSGRVVGFGGRVLDSRTKGVSQKYINSSDSEVYHKLSELYGLYQAKKSISKEHNVFMVEGYTDVISMHQCGIENVVANSGTALNESQIAILHRLTNNITLLYDGDSAGKKAALRGTDMLLEKGMRVKILLLPNDEDPDSFARNHTASEFREYVESHQVDFITFKTNLLKEEAANDPSKMSDLVHQIVLSIALIPEEIERSIHIHQCSEMLHMDEKMLVNSVMKARKQKWEEKLRARENAEKNKQLQNGSSSDAGTQDKVQISASKDDIDPSVPEEERDFVKMEKIIINNIVRFGEQSINIIANQVTSTTTVIDYIYQELVNNHLEFHYPLYRQMLNDVYTAERGIGFKASQYFLNSQNEEYSRIASQLISDPYLIQNTRKEVNESGDEVIRESEINIGSSEVVRLILEYKVIAVNAEAKKVMQQLANPEIMNDPDKFRQVLLQQKEITQAKKELAKQLGERVVAR